MKTFPLKVIRFFQDDLESLVEENALSTFTAKVGVIFLSVIDEEILRLKRLDSSDFREEKEEPSSPKQPLMQTRMPKL